MNELLGSIAEGRGSLSQKARITMTTGENRTIGRDLTEM